MEAKFASIIARVPWWLAAKALAVTFAFLWLPFWAFAIVAVFFYSRPRFHFWRYAGSLGVLLSLFWYGGSVLREAWPMLFWGSVPLLFAAYSILIGMKDLVIVEREQYHLFLLLLLLFGVVALLFSSLPFAFSFFSLAAQTAVFLLLFYEFFSHYAALRGDDQGPWPPVALAGTAALVMNVGVWSISLLPLGFINSSALALILAFFIASLFRTAQRGDTAGTERVMTDLAVSTALVLLVFFFSRWTLGG